MADPSETTQASHDPAGRDAAELLGAVRALSAQVGTLQSELQALRAQARPLPPGTETPGWEGHAPARLDSPAWVRSLDSPAARGPAVPRLLLEILFIVAVAVVAIVARLDTAAVVAVMAVAWGLVALAEWLVDRAARQREEAAYAQLARLGTVFAEDPTWFEPPVERAALEVVEGGERTTKLPPPPSE